MHRLRQVRIRACAPVDGLVGLYKLGDVAQIQAEPIHCALLQYSMYMYVDQTENILCMLLDERGGGCVPDAHRRTEA